MTRHVVLLTALTLLMMPLPARADRGGEGMERQQGWRRGGAAAPNRVVLPPGSPQLRQIRTEAVKTAVVPEAQVVVPGRIVLDPRRVARVSLPVPGRVDQVLVQMGDTVRAGQTLLTLDSPEAETAVAECRVATASLGQATAILRRAQADLERVRDLFEHKAVARKEVLVAEADVAQAQGSQVQAEAACAQAERRLEILGIDADKPRRQVVLRAPLSGKVLEVAATAGEYRNDTTGPVVTIADLSIVLVSSDVPERDIRLVQIGETVSVELVAYPGEVFEGRVARISDTVDAKTRTVTVQAAIANPRGRLRPEMYGRIRHAHPGRTVAVVPARAVVQSAAGAFVFVAREPGVFERVMVRVEPADGERLAVLDGVRAGDQIVVDGVMLLQAGLAGGGR